MDWIVTLTTRTVVDEEVVTDRGEPFEDDSICVIVAAMASRCFSMS